jgi:N-acetylglutamate synthase-like GNAT family acetyltransferase
MLSGIELGREELDGMIEALVANGLHTEDLAGPGKHFFAFDDAEGMRVGFGGVEVHDGDGLLRSVVALQSMRGRGHGTEIVAWLAREAARREVRRLYLLTTDAAEFFERCGFARVERKVVPAAIIRTEQFSILCPPSAVSMMRELPDNG